MAVSYTNSSKSSWLKAPALHFSPQKRLSRQLSTSVFARSTSLSEWQTLISISGWIPFVTIHQITFNPIRWFDTFDRKRSPSGGKKENLLPLVDALTAAACLPACSHLKLTMTYSSYLTLKSIFSYMRSILSWASGGLGAGLVPEKPPFEPITKRQVSGPGPDTREPG